MSRITTFLTASALALSLAGAATAQTAAVADDECEDEAATRDENGNCAVIVLNGTPAVAGGAVVGGLGAGAIVGIVGAGLAAVALGGSGSH